MRRSTSACSRLSASQGTLSTVTRGMEVVTLNMCALRVLSCTGPSKVVVLVDDDGHEEEVEFDTKRQFETWATTNILKLSPKDGRKKYINQWEQLQDGGRYYRVRSLEKTVSGVAVSCLMGH